MHEVPAGRPDSPRNLWECAIVQALRNRSTKIRSASHMSRNAAHNYDALANAKRCSERLGGIEKAREALAELAWPKDTLARD